MAEAIARDLLEKKHGVRERGLASVGLRVASAGVMTSGGSPASGEAVDVMASMGLDLSGHVSQPVTRELLSESSLILAMTRGHLETLLAAAPDVRDRAALLDPEGDIDDPIGQPAEVYERVAKRMRVLLTAVIENYDL